MLQSILLKIAVKIFWHYEPQIVTKIDTVAQAEAKKVASAIASKI